MKVNVISGDITAQKVDAIATLANTGQMWFGGVDGAIMRRFGNAYHKQAAGYLATDPNAEGKTFLSKNAQKDLPGVLFCFDDLNLPLRDLVVSVIKKAEFEHLKTLAFPAFRCGVMASTTSVEVVLTDIRFALKEFSENGMEITFVIYNDSELLQKFTEGLKDF